MDDLTDGVGIDVGSTTVKVVAIRDGATTHREYRRHRGDCRAVALELVASAEEALSRRASRMITGSAGASLADELRASYVQEVHALAAAVQARMPDARTVIELGGQDSKMIHLEGASSAGPGALSSDMNERCAAGTGATLDRCVHRLGLDHDALSQVTTGDRDLPPVSAKCGVFAESDLVSAIKSGVETDRALVALLDAIVRGNLAVLARGRPLPPRVVLLGGPHAFIPALAVLWRKHLAARWLAHGMPMANADDVVVPEGAVYFAAEGALRCATALRRVARARAGSLGRPARRIWVSAGSAAERKAGPPLAETDEEVASLMSRHAWKGIERPPDGRGGLALGLDAGSTTIKAVAVDASGALRARLYRHAGRNPLEEAQRLLAELGDQLGTERGSVEAVGVTGYAADLLGPALGADAMPVETLAHARGALHYVPEADVVCDVGGQDIKVLLIERGTVRTFYLSNQCAAGNGALLEASARDLGVPLERYAEVAFGARRAPLFTVGCAVFLDTERITYQRDGFTPAEILAGIAAVLPRNVWENVVAAPSLAALGRTFVLSGGVQHNAAAVKAQVDYLLRRHAAARIVIHPHPAEAGAIGAALAAREALGGDRTRFMGFSRLANARFATRRDETTRCRRCPSLCSRTVISAEVPGGDTARLMTGYSCERGASDEAHRVHRSRARTGGRNLLRLEAARLFERATPVRRVSSAGCHLRIAIPRVLSMYRSAPFFSHYFEAIGVPREGLLFGPETGEALWRRYAGRGTVDACFPVKVVQAHIAALLASIESRPFDVLFYPVLTHAVTAVEGCADTASCPVVAGTPMVTRAAFGVDAAGRLATGTRLLTPTLTLTRPELLSLQLFDAVHEIAPRLTRAEHEAAITEGRAGQLAFEHALEAEGADALTKASAERRCAVLFLARPYHVDPGIHHDIGSELWAHGRTVLSLRALPKTGASSGRTVTPVRDLVRPASFFTNSGDGEKMAALGALARLPFLVCIEWSSFKCGQDASLYGAVAAAARVDGRPFLALHDMDETRSVASVRLRLRTFLDAVERYERARVGSEAVASALGAI